jgi:dienelactone hydrolase
VHAVVLYSPSFHVNQGLPGGAAWTRKGRPVPLGSIPLDHIGGPLLAVAGADDRLWPSADSVRAITAELDSDHDPHRHVALVYPGAGHGVGTFPSLPAGTRLVDPGDGKAVDLGGSRAADAAAREKGWPRVLAFIATAGH